MKRVYVAGKYSADNVLDVLKNIGRGEKACAKVFAHGMAPFCPWHDAGFCKELTDEEIPKEMYYQNSIAWLEVSDAVYVISGRGDGGGVDREIEIAKKIGIPVFYDFKDLEFWRDWNPYAPKAAQSSLKG